MEEDDLLAWLPEYFVPIKHDVTSVEGYVAGQENLDNLLDVHSQATQSTYVCK